MAHNDYKEANIMMLHTTHLGSLLASACMVSFKGKMLRARSNNDQRRCKWERLLPQRMRYSDREVIVKSKA